MELIATPEELERYRRIASESTESSAQLDEAILLVGRLVQYVIDREFNRDSVQLAVEFNENSRFQADSSDASICHSEIPRVSKAIPELRFEI